MALATWVLVLFLGALHSSNAQMESPLKGRGVPRPETTDIYVSAYLDRLLDVNEDKYRWEAVHYFFISWTDNSAYQKVQENSVQMLTNSSFKCDFYCSNIWEKLLCCDDFYLPSFMFKNAYGFPQDRAIAYNLYTSEDGSMLWEVRVHGSYYQPMDFTHFPFDSFDLVLELRFFDPTILVSTAFLYGENNTGVTVHPSSGGKKLYTIGLGDDASSWAVTDYDIFSYSVDLGYWFSEYSDRNSDPNDPMPLSPTTDILTDEQGNPINVFTNVTDQLLGVSITVERFWRPSLLNAVLPTILVFILGMMVFFTSEAALETRLEIVVTLFLALTAVQFVVIGRIPTSSYVVPTQQLVMATYMYLFLLAVESIIVYNIVESFNKRQEAQRRREAWRKYCRLRDQGKLKDGQNPVLSSAASELQAGLDEEQPTDSSEGMDGKAEAAAEAGHRSAGCFACFGSGQRDVHGENGGPRPAHAGTQGRKPFSIFFHARHKAPALQRSPSAAHQMTADEAFGQYVGHVVDNVSAAFLGISYCVATICIFTLQSGYIDLFPDN